MPTLLPISGKLFPAVDTGTNWHRLKQLIIIILTFGTPLENTITTTRSANGEKEKETGTKMSDDGERC